MRLISGASGSGTSPTAPTPFAIYYGWLSSVNGAEGQVVRVAQAFEGYRLAVLGDDTVTAAGDPIAPAAIATLRARGTAVYGYVSLGMTHSEPALPPDELRLRLRRWRAVGAGGVLLDCAGHDYGVRRGRLDETVSVAHVFGMSVLVNAWEPDDVLQGSRTLGPGDGYLGENDVCAGGTIQTPDDYGAKLACIVAHRDVLGIDLFATASAPREQLTPRLARQILGLLAPYRLDWLFLGDPVYGAADDWLGPAALLMGHTPPTR